MILNLIFLFTDKYAISWLYLRQCPYNCFMRIEIITLFIPFYLVKNIDVFKECIFIVMLKTISLFFLEWCNALLIQWSISKLVFLCLVFHCFYYLFDDMLVLTKIVWLCECYRAGRKGEQNHRNSGAFLLLRP